MKILVSQKVAFLLACTLTVSRGAAEDTPPPPLFTYVSSEVEAEADFAVPRATEWCRCIEIDPTFIRDLEDIALPAFHHFQVPPAAEGDPAIELAFYDREPWGEGSVIWKVKSLRSPMGWGSAIFHKDVVHIQFSEPGIGSFAIEAAYPARDDVDEPEGEPTFVFRKVDLTVPGTCGCGAGHEPAGDVAAEPADAPERQHPLLAPLPGDGAKSNRDAPRATPQPEASTPTVAASGTDSETWIDVALFYTSLSRSDAGSIAAIEARALTMHSSANTALANSNSKTRLRLVHLGEVAYNEPGLLDTSLDWLEDEPLNVDTDRDASGADLVHLLVERQGITSSSSVIGLANNPGVYGVTKWDASALVYAHEIGHNIGLCHENPETGSCAGGYKHAFSITESWDTVIFGIYTETQNTVMWSSTGGLTIPYFSNPSITRTLTGGNCGILCENVNKAIGNASTADNARFLRENKCFSADNREPVFWVCPGWAGAGQATFLAPADDLGDILNTNGWYDVTEATEADVYLKPGAYGPTVISKAVTLKRWPGGSVDVVIGAP